MARRRAIAARVRAYLVLASAVAIPLADGAIDTVVMTWTLCSIADPLTGLREMRRVLKPGGMLVFIEHGLSLEAGVERRQPRLTPMWRHIGGGCHCGPMFRIRSRRNGVAPRHFPYSTSIGAASQSWPIDRHRGWLGSPFARSRSDLIVQARSREAPSRSRVSSVSAS